jgi:iron complex transport system ATP-binding protein
VCCPGSVGSGKGRLASELAAPLVAAVLPRLRRVRTSSLGPDLRGAGCHESPTGGGSEGLERGSSRRDLGGADGTAVVLEGQVDDGARLQGPGSELHTALWSAEGWTEARGSVQVHQGVGGLRPPPGDVEVGEGRGRLLEGQPEGAVRLADVRQLTRGGGVRRPLHGRSDAPRDEPDLTGDDRLTDLEGGGAELARPADPDRVPGLGKGQAAGLDARDPELGEGPGEGHGTVGLGKTGDDVRGVPAEDGIEHEVGDLLASQPGRTPPGEARGDGQGGWHGPSPYAPEGDRALDRVARMVAVIEFADVTVRRGSATLLDAVSWRVAEGERWVILGPNGAGKTTLLQVASAQIHPTDGVAGILDEVLGTVDVFELRPRIGLTSAALAERIPRDERVRDVVVSASYAVVGRWRETYDDLDHDRAHALLASVRADHLLDRTFGTLSEGERKRVQIARALMADPELLLLDEPAAGLDLGGREDLVSTLSTLALDPASPATVLVSHHVEEIPPGFSHAMLLRAGRIVAAGRIREVITEDHLSKTFDMPLVLAFEGGRWTARRRLRRRSDL